MSPSTSSSSKKSVSVTFASYSEQYSVLHINDYTQDEIDAAWYTREELKQVKAQVRHTLNKVRHGIPLVPNDDDCFMGLKYSSWNVWFRYVHGMNITIRNCLCLIVSFIEII